MRFSQTGLRQRRWTGNITTYLSRIWHYGPAEALALVNRGLQQSHTVYALFVSRRDMEEKMVRLPHVDDYEWVLAEDPTAEAAILKLSPRR